MHFNFISLHSVLVALFKYGLIFGQVDNLTFLLSLELNFILIHHVFELAYLTCS